ncbi:hypothetical protein [Nonomuraea sp. SYSU D8015]|uniref:hypothetical protein n=1 Tax=Nonomuraea sp. SYSU D8015 TaxID=2593644 RepID=UPI00166048A1|nr:hypothetical protein [Nonomuraea sp. SYSU D8015]
MKASRLAVAVMASTLMGAGLLSASATSAGAVTTAQASTADPCVIRDGTSSKGYRVGSNPTRYTYDDTPYLGARYNSCTNKVTLYYGGYSAAPGYYYNLRTGAGAQWEVQPGSARKYTMRAPGGTYMTAMVQLCRRGELLHRSTCTRWSPQVRVALD